MKNNTLRLLVTLVCITPFFLRSEQTKVPLTPIKCVITGAPLVGKTSTVNYLNKLGYLTVCEAATALITEDKNKKDGDHPQNSGQDNFQLRIMQKQMELEAEEEEKAKSGNCPKIGTVVPIFCDRGMHDGFAYYRLYNEKPSDEFVTQADVHPYCPYIFLLSPLTQVKQKHDAIRIEDKKQMKLLHEYIKEAYENRGYIVVEVPEDTIENRAKFIVSVLLQNATQSPHAIIQPITEK